MKCDRVRVLYSPVAIDMFHNWYRGFTECARIINGASAPNRQLPCTLSQLVSAEHKLRSYRSK